MRAMATILCQTGKSARAEASVKRLITEYLSTKVSIMR